MDIFWDATGRLVMPVVTMVAVVSAMIIRVMRSTLLDVLNQDFIRTAPWLSIIPGIAIASTVIGFNLMGDSLRDVLDPSMKK